ncbi:Ycf66 family protein [Thermosynechococcus vestitus]|uniref:Tlr0372 protein n=1 Tax=Thermosynechococcus vestitus (strain NIES-2133 / IAM M-273 / BP-1) TaxID=197221 RepID=Q8DLV4_THEVB|nr:Ycf66 family protein [Thermosynechococcus vestitus]BAC07924.1 tlr0372 [Thermosynechococcus vestitus BP-1]
MLTNLLAWSMAIASLGLYLLGFFLPELYRRFDLVASGAGLFFALTLWIYGDRIGGGLLLGTTAAVALILWFGGQTLSYRWQLTHPGDRTDTQKAQALWQRVKSLLPEAALAKVSELLKGLVSPVASRFQKQPDRPQPAVDIPPPPMDTGNIKEDLWTASTPSPVAEQPTPATEEAAAVPAESAEPEPTASPTADTPADHEGGAEMTAPEESNVETLQPPTATTPEEPEPGTVTASEEASEEAVTPSEAPAAPETGVEAPEATVTATAPAEPASPETVVNAPEPTATPEPGAEPLLASEPAPAAQPAETMPPVPESRTSAADLLGEIPENSDVEDEAMAAEITIENPEPVPPQDSDWPPPEARL